MIKAKTVSIIHDDSLTAGERVAAQLLDELGAPPDLVLLFASWRYRHREVLEGIYRHLPAETRLVGCSSYAEINAEEGLGNSATAMGIRLGGVELRTFKIEGIAADPRARGRELGAAVRAFDPALLILLPDGTINATRFLLGLQQTVGERLPIVGGMAVDDARFIQTFQLHDREVISGGAVAVALRGPVEIVTVAKSGWLPIGATRTCTKVEGGNVVLEIDGRPALELYRDYLGPRAAEMPSVSVEFPVGLVGGLPSSQKLPDEAILLLRSVKGIDEARQALIFGGDIPEGAEIRMTRATKEDIIRGADEASAKVLTAMPDPSLALLFNCGGRKVVLGPRYKEELVATFERLGPNVPRIGFYSCGEFSPVQGVTMHHDETFTMALIKG